DRLGTATQVTVVDHQAIKILPAADADGIATGAKDVVHVAAADGRLLPLDTPATAQPVGRVAEPDAAIERDVAALEHRQLVVRVLLCKPDARDTDIGRLGGHEYGLLGPGREPDRRLTGCARLGWRIWANEMHRLPDCQRFLVRAGGESDGRPG